jgi:hypothetical protein
MWLWEWVIQLVDDENAVLATLWFRGYIICFQAWLARDVFTGYLAGLPGKASYD